MDPSDSRISPTDLVQLLDEHHVVVLADDPRQRRQFTRVLSDHLNAQPQTEVVVLDGANMTDLPSLVRELTRRAGRDDPVDLPPDGEGERGVPAPDPFEAVIDLLRQWPGTPHHRYLLWREADVLLDADLALFARFVNALFAVAAEREHLNAEPLILQRVALIGNAKLGAYAEDERGQFSCWLEDEEGGSPFWEVMSCVDRPPVITCRLDD